MRAGRYRAEPLSLEIPVGPTDRSLLAPRWCLPEPPGERVLTGHPASGRGAAFSPDGTLLASGSRDGIVRLWDAADGRLIRTLEGHADTVRAVAFSPDGSLLATIADDDTVRLWDPARGELTRTLEGNKRPSEVAFSPDGTLLATAGIGASVLLWDAACGELARTLTGHDGSVGALAFSPDGTLLASGTHDGIVRLWDPVRGELTHTLNGHESWLDALAFSPDGSLLASGGRGRTVRLWKRGHGSWGRPAWGLLQRRRSASARLRGPDHIDALAFSGHGRTLAIVTTDSITLWDIASRTALWRARTGARIAAFAPGADAVATAVDAAVGVFDIVDGRLNGAGSRTTPSEPITHP